jgi:predicted acylesterase/phospholipase RssA
MKKVSRRHVLKLATVGTVVAGTGASEAEDQPKTKPLSDTFDVALAGGGIKGVALAGALDRLASEKFRLRRLIGSSAGAITATFLAAGYKNERVLELLTERTAEGRNRFSAFLDPPLINAVPHPDGVDRLSWVGVQLALDKAFSAKKPQKESTKQLEFYVRCGLSMLSSAAIADDQPFLTWMRQRLTEQKLAPDITLKDFHKESTRARGMHLSLVAADVTMQQTLVLNAHTAPDLPVVQAVRMSMSIPLVWKEVEWKSDWGPYRKLPMWDGAEGHRIVDGGLLSNFPLKFLLNDQKYSTPDGLMGPLPGGQSARILGLLLDSNKEAPKEIARKKERYAERLAVYQSVSRLIDTITSASDKEAIEEYRAEPHICRIGVRGVDLLDFEMTEDQLKALVKGGDTAMTDYLKTLKP